MDCIPSFHAIKWDAIHKIEDYAMLEEIRRLSQHFLKIKNAPYRRYLIGGTEFKHRLSIIIGQRGIGKTTTLIQALLDKVQGDHFDPRILYVQVDHFQVSNISLYEIAEGFLAHGGKWLALDEIHKYPKWSLELKSIYDTFPELVVLASGSSALEIYRGSHDLTRRALCYPMQGMSFREFLGLTQHIDIEPLSLSDICQNHERHSEKILSQLAFIDKKVLVEFHQYLKVGYYPFFYELEDTAAYNMILEQNIHTTIESDFAAIYPHLTGVTLAKLKQLMVYIANSVPFTPQWNKIKDVLEIGDLRTLRGYFKILEDAALIRSVSRATAKFSQMETPEKIYLDNPNQLYAIASSAPEKGTTRETFFLNMLSQKHATKASKEGDFIVDDLWVFEVGGKKKSFDQIKHEKNAYLACDDIEQGIGRKVPLWLFGLLY